MADRDALRKALKKAIFAIPEQQLVSRDIIIHAIESTLVADPEQQEPVAWKYRVMTAPNEWRVTLSESWARSLNGDIDVIPLYASPIREKKEWISIEKEQPENDVPLYLVSWGRVVEGYKTWRQGWAPDRFVINGIDMPVADAGVTYWMLKTLPAAPSQENQHRPGCGECPPNSTCPRCFG